MIHDFLSGVVFIIILWVIEQILGDELSEKLATVAGVAAGLWFIGWAISLLWTFPQVLPYVGVVVGFLAWAGVYITVKVKLAQRRAEQEASRWRLKRP